MKITMLGLIRKGILTMMEIYFINVSSGFHLNKFLKILLKKNFKSNSRQKRVENS